MDNFSSVSDGGYNRKEVNDFVDYVIKKTEENILDAIKTMGTKPDRLPLAVMLPIVEDIELKLQAMENIIRFSRAGSVRRGRETIKDLDFIIATDNPSSVKEQILSLTNIDHIFAAGDTKVSLALMRYIRKI